MIKIPEYQEVVEIVKGSKSVFVFILEDENYNEVNITGHTFTCKLVDEKEIEQTGGCSITVENNRAILTIDTANLLEGSKYICEAEDTTLSLCIAQIEVHVLKSIIH